MRRSTRKRIAAIFVIFILILGLGSSVHAGLKTRYNVKISYDKVQHGLKNGYLYCRYDDFRFKLKYFYKYSYNHYLRNYVNNRIDHYSWVRNNYNYKSSGWARAHCYNISVARIRNVGGGTYSWQVRHSGW